MIRHLVSLSLLGLVLALPAHADEIILRRTVRIHHDGEAVLLADIARIEGDHAKRLADVKVARFTDRTRPLKITVTEVAKVLDRAGINRALIDLSGSSVIVRPFARPNPRSNGPALCAPLKLETENVVDAVGSKSSPKHTNTPKDFTVMLDPRTIVGEDTVRGLIAMRLAPHWRDLTVPVRLQIRTGVVDILDRQNVRPTVKAVGSAGQSSYAFSVTTADRLPISVIASIEVNVLASRVKDDLKRGEYVGHSDIEITTQWVGLHDMKSVTSTSSMLGKPLDSQVKKGVLLRPHHFKPVVRRNDSIKVVSGGSGFSLELDCISLEDGHVGQTIDVRTNTSGKFTRNTTPIRVVVIDAGRAKTLN